MTLDGVTMTHVGEAAVMFGPGSNANAVKNSALSDIGATAIIVGQEPRRNLTSYPENLANGPSTDQWKIGGATIYNNLITDFGHLISNSTGVYFGRGVANSIISHNEMSFGPGWAIVIGWDPGAQVDPLFPGPRHNEVSWNYIHDLGFGGDTTAQDWGAIYTAGPQDGTIIEYNKVMKIATPVHPSFYGGRLNSHGRDGMLLYNDDRSHGLTIRNNLFSGAANFLHSLKGTGNTVVNNIFYAKNDGSSYAGASGIFFMFAWSQYIPEHGQPFGSVTRNIYVIDRGLASAVPVNLARSSNPSSEPGPDIVASDDNLYFQAGAAITNFAPDYTLEAWRSARGQDAHSLFNVDPLFADAAAGDFSLRPDSPAFKLGFTPFDLSAAGRK